MTWTDWLSLVAVVLAALTTTGAYLRQSPFVPASQLEELRKQIADMRAENIECRTEIDRLRARVNDLEAQSNILRAGEDFWRREYQRLREASS